MSSTSTSSHPASARNHRSVAIVCAAVVVGMIGVSYAAVPLYRMFCQVTGFGGTPQIASEPSQSVLDQTITVRFDANVSKKLAWKFAPLERTIELRIGENRITNYRATNVSDRPLTGTATFNVSPDSAGIHFNKIECFCFTEQTLQPGESVDMPVSFFIDPEIVNDPNAAHFTQLTLSYTFYPAKAENETNARVEMPATNGNDGLSVRGGSPG